MKGRKVYFFLLDFANGLKSRQCYIHLSKASSISMPDGSAITKPFIVRPVKFAGLQAASARYNAYWSGGMRHQVMLDDATHILSFTVKQRPPIIFCSLNRACLLVNEAGIRSAKCSSSDIRQAFLHIHNYIKGNPTLMYALAFQSSRLVPTPNVIGPIRLLMAIPPPNPTRFFFC